MKLVEHNTDDTGAGSCNGLTRSRSRGGQDSASHLDADDDDAPGQTQQLFLWCEVLAPCCGWCRTTTQCVRCASRNCKHRRGMSHSPFITGHAAWNDFLSMPPLGAMLWNNTAAQQQQTNTVAWQHQQTCCTQGDGVHMYSFSTHACP